MRTWVKATIWGAALLVVCLAALGATGAYFVLRHLDKRTGAEADAVQAIDAVKARFGPRAPLVEVVDPIRADIRINRTTDTSATRVDTVHIINWRSDTGELTRADVPLWLMRFSSVNLASQLGLAPAKFRLTVGEIERYGPGIIVNYGSQGSTRFLMWVE